MKARILTHRPRGTRMPQPLARALASLLLFILASAASAHEPAPLPGADGRVALGAYVSVLEDPGGRLQLDDVRRPEAAAPRAQTIS